MCPRNVCISIVSAGSICPLALEDLEASSFHMRSSGKGKPLVNATVARVLSKIQDSMRSLSPEVMSKEALGMESEEPTGYQNSYRGEERKGGRDEPGRKP
jgi:hypothetical protein